MRSSGEIHGVGSSRGSLTIPYGGGFGRDPQWDYWGYQRRERAPTPRLRERPKEVEKEQPPDYSHAPPATPRKDATVKVVVMGDANADWPKRTAGNVPRDRPEPIALGQPQEAEHQSTLRQGTRIIEDSRRTRLV
jgi:hypothetical protein